MVEHTIKPDQLDQGAAEPSIEATPGLGAQLRAGREAAGLSIDQAAQQLKLAPRQVRALEQEAFGELPGKTFTRGFVRNYARLLELDPVALLLQLPDAAHAPALESPTLHSAGSLMAELPSNDPRKPMWTRWGIPLALVATIAGVLGYEWYRGDDSARSERPPATSKQTSPRAPVEPTAATATAPSETSVSAAAATSGPAQPIEAGAKSTSSIDLPLPRTSAEPPVATSSALPSTLVASSVSSAPSASIASPASSTITAATSAAPERVARSAAAEPKVTNPTATTDGSSIRLDLSQASWVEVKDSTGAMLVAQIIPARTQRVITGKPPFEIVVGNIHAVKVNYRGQRVDLVPYTRQNVARLTLR